MTLRVAVGPVDSWEPRRAGGRLGLAHIPRGRRRLSWASNGSSAWAGAYRPRELSAVRITTPEGGVAGLGLIEHLGFRRWRFAGWPVTTQRGLLCRPGLEDEAWDALAAWLNDHPGEWSMVDAEGLEPLSFPGSLRVSSDQVAWFGVDLPDSFDEFLERQPAKRRREIQAEAPCR